MLLVKVFIHILKIFTACHLNDILPEGTSRPLTAAASSLRQSLFSTELSAVTQVPGARIQAPLAPERVG